MKPLRTGLLPVIFLVVIIAWALFAVAMLTGTLVAAQKIETRVGVINQVYPEVNQNLDNIAKAKETGRIAEEITKAVAPIGPQFTQVVDAVASINTSAKSIEGAVAEINGNVKAINTSVLAVGDTVTSIDSRLTSVKQEAREINGSVRGIAGHFDDVLNEVRSIDDRVKGINDRADIIIGAAGAIKSDLDQTLAIALQINQNAAAIANNGIIQLNPFGTLANLLAFLGLPSLPLSLSADLPADVPAPLEPPTDLVAADPAAEAVPELPSIAEKLGELPVAVPAPVIEEPVPSVPLDGLLGN